MFVGCIGCWVYPAVGCSLIYLAQSTTTLLGKHKKEQHCATTKTKQKVYSCTHSTNLMGKRTNCTGTVFSKRVKIRTLVSTVEKLASGRRPDYRPVLCNALHNLLHDLPHYFRITPKKRLAIKWRRQSPWQWLTAITVVPCVVRNTKVFTTLDAIRVDMTTVVNAVIGGKKETNIAIVPRSD